MDNDEIFSVADNRYLYLSEYNQVIHTCMKDLFLKHGGNRKIAFQELIIDQEEIARDMRRLPQITFEVTENCNLRCKYCVYNGHYNNHRQVSPLSMDFEIARKGLDYIFSLIKDRKKKEFSLGFYGGEPMLNIKTIKEILAYGKRLFPGWKLRFHMTTNLTLLDDALLDFLLENDFNLLVSLDGGKENHDAKRVYTNGGGSFDTVYGNLERIAARDKDFFTKNVSFSTVYSPDLSLKKLYNFFVGQDLIKNKKIRFTMVSTIDTDYYEECPCDWEVVDQEINEVSSQFYNKLRQREELSGYEQSMLSSLTQTGAYLENLVRSFLAGTCLFESRVYLDARGQFHICEKINSTLPIGDVERGFDFKKMVRIAMDFCEVIRENCSDCGLWFLCKPCFVHFAGDGTFRFDQQFCSTQKTLAIKNLERYIRFKEERLI